MVFFSMVYYSYNLIYNVYEIYTRCCKQKDTELLLCQIISYLLFLEILMYQYLYSYHDKLNHIHAL